MKSLPLNLALLTLSLSIRSVLAAIPNNPGQGNTGLDIYDACNDACWDSCKLGGSSAWANNDYKHSPGIEPGKSYFDCYCQEKEFGFKHFVGHHG
ncbi:hypothetical protein EJ03DRAFT_356318 [Teratosphaeria nubilosa]|uniref:Uncharacterized protein n=1 Tax=Teratosphaeria nubilosa TaxID=161662 RepID=A0A6G1KTS9_9PEZI|nr:hypothetical protein EJ03DRAFT_356318 [Teratosphaeria nubilosa]